jgi:hypothetical protein
MHELKNSRILPHLGIRGLERLKANIDSLRSQWCEDGCSPFDERLRLRLELLDCLRSCFLHCSIALHCDVRKSFGRCEDELKMCKFFSGHLSELWICSEIILLEQLLHACMHASLLQKREVRAFAFVVEPRRFTLSAIARMRSFDHRAKPQSSSRGGAKEKTR